MNDVTEGIVLSSMEYREKDALISVLTKEFGRIALIGKGLLSLQSKNASGCTPYATSEFCFDYKEGKTVFPLKTARIKHSRRLIREDFDLLNLAGLLCELSEKICEQGTKQREFYEALDASLSFLEKDKYLSVCLFLAFVERFIGVEPMVDECVCCGNTTVSSVSVKEGGFVCEKCRASCVSKNCTLDELIHFRLISKAKFEHFELLHSKYHLTLNDVSLRIEFIQYHTGIHIRSWDWIRSLMD